MSGWFSIVGSKFDDVSSGGIGSGGLIFLWNYLKNLYNGICSFTRIPPIASSFSFASGDHLYNGLVFESKMSVIFCFDADSGVVITAISCCMMEAAVCPFGKKRS